MERLTCQFSQKLQKSQNKNFLTHSRTLPPFTFQILYFLIIDRARNIKFCPKLPLIFSDYCQWFINLHHGPSVLNHLTHPDELPLCSCLRVICSYFFPNLGTFCCRQSTMGCDPHCSLPIHRNFSSHFRIFP